jgi:hypothetical protein
MTLITAVMTALRATNPQGTVSRLEDMLNIHVAEGLPPLCVLGHNYHDRHPVLHQIVTQEMHVLHALARKDIDVVLAYLNARAGRFAAPACIQGDHSIAFVWYARALAEDIKKEPTLEKWDWLSKVVQRNILEDKCPAQTQFYNPETLVHFHVTGDESVVLKHPQSEGVYVYATPQRIYVVTPEKTRRYQNLTLSALVQDYVQGRKAPRLQMQTMYGEDTGYSLNVVQGAYPFCRAALGSTLSGKFELIGEAGFSIESIPTFQPPPRHSETMILYAFDASGKGVYDLRQVSRSLHSAGSAGFSLSIIDN